MRSHLPQWAIRILKLISSREDFEYFLGDLEEITKSKKGNRIAYNLLIIRSLISFIKPFVLIKKLQDTRAYELLSTSIHMKLAVRDFVRNKAYSFTALFVLSIGIFTALMITKFVQYEFSFDKHHESSQQIYRVTQHIQSETETITRPIVPAPLSVSARMEIAEVDLWARICKFRANGIYQVDESNVYSEPNYLWAEQELLDILKIEVIQGDIKTALNESKTLVITESIALKYFGTPFAVDRLITFKTSFYEDVEMRVTAVIKDLPKTSHIQFDLLNSFKTLEVEHYQSIIDNWEINYYYTYLKAVESAKAENIVSGLNRIVDQNLAPERAANITLDLEPITDIYLNPLGEGWRLGPSSNIRYLDFLVVIGVMVLVMSVINYVSLATARSMKRVKEIGIRKSLGAYRSQIFAEHLTGSIVLALLSLLVAFLLLWVALPIVNQSFNRAIEFSILQDSGLILKAIGVSITVGLISGFYPAVMMGSFNVIDALKTAKSPKGQFNTLRKSLVVGQLVASMVVLIATVLVFQQLQFVRKADVGFNREHLLVVPLGAQETIDKFELFKTELENLPMVHSFSVSSQHMGSNQFFGEDFTLFVQEVSELRSVSARRFEISHDFLETLGADFVAGRNFNRSFTTDATEGVVVNEAFLKAAGITDPSSFLGQEISVDFNWGETLNLNLLGVVSDFHMKSMKSKIDPAVFYIRPEEAGYAHLRLSANSPNLSISEVEQTMKSIAPELAFDFFFQDDKIQSLYADDKQLQQLLNFLMIISICIAGLGLFSLAYYMVQQRTREVGIRKVLGASRLQIGSAFLLYFMKLVLVAVLIATPLAYLVSTDWLNGFAYRIELGMLTFLPVVGFILLLLLLSIGFQLFKLTVVHPAKVLRND